MAELVSIVQVGYLPRKRGTGFMEAWCKLCNSKCCADLPGVSQTERKGRSVRSESARRAGLRILGLTQKVGMVNVHLVVHNYILAHLVEHSKSIEKVSVRFRQMYPAKECTASGKKIHLLF